MDPGGQPLQDSPKLRKDTQHLSPQLVAWIPGITGVQKGGLLRWLTRTRSSTAPVQKVVVVNGNTEVLGMLETVLDAGRYDMVFVVSSDRAYTQIQEGGSEPRDSVHAHRGA